MYALLRGEAAKKSQGLLRSISHALLIPEVTRRAQQLYSNG